MGALLSGIWSKIVFGAVFVGLLLLAVLKLIGAGKKIEQAEQAKRNDTTRRRMEDADARGPRSADDVDKRLRSGEF